MSYKRLFIVDSVILSFNRLTNYSSFPFLSYNIKALQKGGKTLSSSCQRLADIIGGEVVTSTPVCLVQRLRDIDASILGRRTRSPLALPFALSFEDNFRGKSLNLGETVILQDEINDFMSALRRRGLIVTAVHNHWLFDQPRLMYMHWEDVGDAFRFADDSFEAALEAGLF